MHHFSEKDLLCSKGIFPAARVSADLLNTPAIIPLLQGILAEARFLRTYHLLKKFKSEAVDDYSSIPTRVLRHELEARWLLLGGVQTNNR